MPKSKLVDHFSRILTPYLSKALGHGRRNTLKGGWRADLPRPPNRPFVPSAEPAPAVTHAFAADKLRGSGNGSNKFSSADFSRPYRILCLDGGGVRGALTTVILTRICQHNPNFLKEIDFICGTSAGGILSLMLASGYSAQECHEIYTYAAPHIFTHNPWRVVNPTRARYSDKQKQELMQHYFGQRTMADLEMTCAAVAFRLDGRKSRTHSFFDREGWRPAVFSNMPMAEGLVAPDNDLLVWDAAMRTSAAPTYFPVFHGYTDGGIVANNPSILAVSKAMAHYPHVSTKNVAVLSIGAGSYPRHMNIFQQIHEERDAPLVIDGQIGGDMGGEFHGTRTAFHQQGLLSHADWGVKQWLPFLLDLLLDGESVTTEMVMHYLLAGNKMYHRLDPRLPKNFALDDVTMLQEIQDYAWTVDLTETLEFVDNFFSDEEEMDISMAHNALDNASHYHDAWMYEVAKQNLQKAEEIAASSMNNYILQAQEKEEVKIFNEEMMDYEYPDHGDDNEASITEENDFASLKAIKENNTYILQKS